MKDKIGEECGVFGVFGSEEADTSKLVYTALFALQHRGQESCGIAVNGEAGNATVRGQGLVGKVFDERALDAMRGNMGIGHVRYSTCGGDRAANAQPMTLNYIKGTLSIAHNGNIYNAAELRREMQKKGAIFSTTSDTEVIAYLIAWERLKTHSVEEAVKNAVLALKGSYSMLVMSPRKLIAARDPYGFRPLCLGSLGDLPVCASETCALDAVGADFVRDVEPGEIVLIDREGVRTVERRPAARSAACIFEYIYFARPDSVIDGQCVYDSRVLAGKILADQSETEADIVFGVPDSGVVAALGYAEESGIPYCTGLVKNRYIARTFIQPTQAQRARSVRQKLNVISSRVKDKRVIIVDDSIVRGTTIRQIVALLRHAGAREIHLKISSPPFLYPCYYGTDVPDRELLLASGRTTEEMNRLIGTDSLTFLDASRMREIIPDCARGYCDGCFTGRYPDGKIC